MAKTSAKATDEQDVGFLNELAGEGFDNITAEDFAIPFLRILQPLSPQLDEDSENYIPGAKPGMFFNTVTNFLYGTEIKLIPLMYKKVWLEWAPNRGGLVGRHDPHTINVDKSDFSRWTTDEGNLVSENHMFYVLVADHLDHGPMIFSQSSTGIKHAKNWNTQIMMTRLPSGKRAPFFSSVWKLETVKNKNDQGTWYQLGEKSSHIVRERFVTAEEYNGFISPARDTLDTLKDPDYAQLETRNEAGPSDGDEDEEEGGVEF